MKTYSSQPAADESSRGVNCNLCGSRSFHHHYELSGAKYVRCRHCGLVFQNPQPLARNIAERYSREYFEYEKANESAFRELALLGLGDIEFYKRVPEAKLLGPFLDVGCATGFLLLKMQEEGWKVEGVEICRESAEFAQSRGGFPVYQEPLETLALPPDRFGAVHLSHVIEHLNDPLEFCLEVYRITAPGGFFIVTTPNIHGLQSRLLGVRWRSAIPDHLYLFDRRTVTDLVEKAGFQKISQKTWGGLARGIAPAWLKSVFDKAVKPLGWGDVMITLFRKP